MSSELIERFETTKEKVRYLLHRYPSARESPKMVFVLFLKYFTPVKIDFIPKHLVEEMIPHPDTIARTIRQIQNTERDPYAQPSPKMKKLREEAEEVMTQYFAEESS